MLNLHCNNNDKNIKKVMRLPRYMGSKGHQGIHYAMEANAIYG